MQRRLAVAAAEWEAVGRESAELWRGPRLVAALDFADARPDEVTRPSAPSSTRGSCRPRGGHQAAQHRAAETARQNTRLRRLLGGTAVLLVLALVAGAVALRSRSAASAASAAADARRLAASALNVEAHDLALLTAVEATTAEKGPQTYGALLTLLARQPEVVLRLRSPDRFLNVSASPDGRTVFLGENRARFRAVDAETGEVLWDLPTPGEGQPGPLVPLADGSGVFTSFLSAESPTMGLVEPSTGALRWTIGAEQVVATAGAGASPYVWSGGQRADGRLVFATDSHVLVAEASDGRLLEAVAWPSPLPYSGDLLVWPDGRVSREAPDDLTRGLVFDPAVPAGGFREIAGVPLALSPDGRRVVVGRESGGVAQVRVLDAATYAPTTEWLDVGAHIPRSAQWSADGTRLLVPADETVQLRDGTTGALLHEMHPHAGEVMGAVHAGPGGDLVWTASRDGTAALLDLSGRRTVVRRLAGTAEPYTGALARAGDVGVSSVFAPEGEPNTARLLDLRTGADRGELPLDDVGCDCQVMAVAMTPDGAHALAALEEYDPQTGPLPRVGHLAVWRTSDRSLEQVMRLPWAPYAVAVAPDGRTAVVSGRFGYAFVDLTSYAVVGEPVRQDESEWLRGLLDVAISPDGRRVAMGRGDEVLVVDAATGAVVRRARVGDEGVRVQALAWSPDGRALAASSEAGWLAFLDAEDLRPLAPRRLITDGWVLDLAFSPDGALLASLGGGGDLMLWDTRSWQPYGEPVTDDRTYGFLDFRDDDRVRVLFQDQVVTEVMTRPEEWRRAACRAANRDLTADESAVLRPGAAPRSTCAQVL